MTGPPGPPPVTRPETVPPLSSEVSGAQRARALITSLAERCQADAAVLLVKEDANWRVMAVAGPALRGIQAGDLFSSAQNPSLSADLGGGRPDLPSEAEPFLAALGPVALGDWITFPLLAGGEPTGLLHLMTGWRRPFSSEDVEAAAGGAKLAASLLAGEAPEAAALRPEAADDGLHAELACATSQLNHDLRSPLNAILGFAEMLAEGGCSGEQVARYARIIAQGGESLQDMVDGLVGQLRILLDIHPWQPERAPVGVFLAGLPATGDLGQAVHWDTTAVARACRALLATVAGQGGEARLCVEARGGHVHLEFGVPPAENESLDARFGGIGAQFARQVFAAHGGTIRVGGNGTWFGVRLPAEPPRFAASAGSGAA